MHKQKRILVAGGAGFIGSNLCRQLLKENHFVICLDNLFSSEKENIIPLLKNNNFEFIRHDIINPIHLEVDEIYNLACPASPIHYQKDPIKTIKTSIAGSINLLDLAEKVNAKILQASTSEIYGDPHVHPQPEDYNGNVNLIGPRACYDEGKRCAETLFFDYYRQKNVDIKVVRIFNTYGPNMHPNDGRVISNFIVQSLKNKDITVYGRGQQTRSFCYVDDLISGFLAMMDSKYFCGPVNIGSQEEFTVLDLAKKIIKLTGSKSKIIYKKLPIDDPRKRRPNLNIAKEKLKWSPKTSIDDGLKKTIEYFKYKV